MTAIENSQRRIQWSTENPEKQLKWNRDNWHRILVHKAKRRAKLKNIDFSLPGDYFAGAALQCIYCQRALMPRQYPRGPANPSIDRVRPELGYVPGNVVIACWQCNDWKGDMRLEDIVELANNVAKQWAKERGIPVAAETWAGTRYRK